MVIRVSLRIGMVRDDYIGPAVGLVLTLALLILYHAALLIQPGLIDGPDQVSHTIGLHP